MRGRGTDHVSHPKQPLLKYWMSCSQLLLMLYYLLPNKTWFASANLSGARFRIRKQIWHKSVAEREPTEKRSSDSANCVKITRKSFFRKNCCRFFYSLLWLNLSSHYEYNAINQSTTTTISSIWCHYELRIGFSASCVSPFFSNQAQLWQSAAQG